jgi:hypothetical protein
MGIPRFTAAFSLGRDIAEYWAPFRESHPRVQRPGMAPQFMTVGTGGVAGVRWWWPRCPPGCFATGNSLRPCFCWSVQGPFATL